MFNDSLDNYAILGDNVGTNDVHAAVANHYLTAPHVIKMDEQTPLNDPECIHFLVEDRADTLGDFTAWICTKCGLGTFCPPGFNPNE